MFSPLRPLGGPYALGAAVTLLLAAATASAQTFYSHGDPTADEQFELELINAARANPAATGDALASTRDPFLLSGFRNYGVDVNLLRSQFAFYPARPPLAFSPLLLQAARSHTADMVAHNVQSHTGSDGSTPYGRCTAAGFDGNYINENAGGAVGFPSHEALIYGGFLVDWGVPSIGHRSATLDLDSSRQAVEIGIGCGSGFAVTQDFGYYSAARTPRYLTGVAYRDLNGNDRYDQGEGIAGLAITVDGNSLYTVTGESGGYSLPLDHVGGFTARAAGGTLVDFVLTHSAATSGENVKWDLVWAADGSAPKQEEVVAANTVSVVGDLARRGFVVSRTGDTSAPLKAVYHVGGAAIGGVDYLTLPGSVVIRAGQSEVLVPVVAYTDHAKVKIFLDALGYGVGKSQSKILLANL